MIVVMMRVIMIMMMIMIVVMMMAVRMTVRMVMLVIIIMMMQTLARPWAARVFAEDQRLDGDRNRIGRHADAAEIDVVEIP